MKLRCMHLAAAVALAVLGSPAAFGTVLTFSGNICTTNANGSGGPSACVSNGAYISNAYGSGPNVQLTYFATSVNGSSTLTTWIDPNVYGNLTGVAYGFFGADYASVTFAPTSGNTVALNSVDFGATNCGGCNRPVTAIVIDLANNQTVFSTSFNLAGGTASSLNFGGLSSSAGLEFRYSGDTFNVAIDNLDFNVSAAPTSGVPEPTTLSLVGAAVACVIIGRRTQPRP